MLKFDIKASSDIAEQRASMRAGIIESNYDDMECAFCISDGYLFYRVYSDYIGYMIGFPVCLEEGKKENALALALAKITEYCLREDIPESIVDVPPYALTDVLLGVQHCEVHAWHRNEGCYFVEIKNELSYMCGEISHYCERGVRLVLPENKYCDDYEKLVKDREHNKYYGYELTDDKPDAAGADMIAELIRDFEAARSLTLFAVDDARGFIGEAVIYSLDGRNGAEISFRVLPELCGAGYGSIILSGLISFGKEMGLGSLFATVHPRNEISLKLLKKFGFIETAASENAVRLAFVYSCF